MIILAGIDSYWSVHYLTKLHLVIFILCQFIHSWRWQTVAGCLVFVVKFLGAPPLSFITHCLWQVNAIMAKPAGSLKPNIFTVWSLIDKVFWSLLRNISLHNPLLVIFPNVKYSFLLFCIYGLATRDIFSSKFSELEKF